MKRNSISSLAWLTSVFGSLALSMPATAQSEPQSSIYKDRDGNYQGAIGTFCIPAKDGSGCNPPAAARETFTLVSANAPASAVMVYGGNYTFAQGCTTYGTLALRYRGPDGATMLTLVSKTATDASGATLVQLGSNSVLDVTVTGTTGCNASLSRVP